MLEAADGDLPDLQKLIVIRGDEGDHTSWAEFLDAGVDREGENAAEVEARIAELGSNDISDLIFTSGTTGRPKGVVATHGQTLRVFAEWSSIVGLRHRDRYLVVNPFFHTFGFKAGFLSAIMRGATTIPHPVFDVPTVLARVAEEGVTMLPGPPTLHQSILDHPDRATYDLSSLRLCVTGAAVVPVEMIKRMRTELTYETIITGYGLTESTGVVAMCRPEDNAETIATTSGRAIPDTEMQVVDDKGREVPRGEPGEIVVRGYHVMSGYFDDPEADRRGRRSERMAAHRRHRHDGRTGLHPHHRPQEGHVHRRRFQRLSRRDRERHPRPPAGRPGGRGRPPRRAHGRGRHGLRRSPTRGGADTWIVDRLVPRSAWRTTRCPDGSTSSTRCRSTPAARSSSTSCATAAATAPKAPVSTKRKV